MVTIISDWVTIYDTPHDKRNFFFPPVFLQPVIVRMGERPKVFPGFPVEPPPGLLDLSRHYPRHVLDRLNAHFPRFPPAALPGTIPDPSSVHIKRERRESLSSVAYLQHPVKTEPADHQDDQEVGQDLSYHARDQEQPREHYDSAGRELPRSFSLPAPREVCGPPPQRQVSLERGREGGAQPPNPKPETSSRTLIGNSQPRMKMQPSLTD